MCVSVCALARVYISCSLVLIQSYPDKASLPCLPLLTRTLSAIPTSINPNPNPFSILTTNNPEINPRAYPAETLEKFPKLLRHPRPPSPKIKSDCGTQRGFLFSTLCVIVLLLLSTLVSPWQRGQLFGLISCPSKGTALETYLEEVLSVLRLADQDGSLGGQDGVGEGDDSFALGGHLQGSHRHGCVLLNGRKCFSSNISWTNHLPFGNINKIFDSCFVSQKSF